MGCNDDDPKQKIVYNLHFLFWCFLLAIVVVIVGSIGAITVVKSTGVVRMLKPIQGSVVIERDGSNNFALFTPYSSLNAGDTQDHCTVEGSDDSEAVYDYWGNTHSVESNGTRYHSISN